MRVKVNEPLEGKFWNLKVGCVYEIETAAAHKLVEAGSVEPLIETAVQPPPGANKRVRKSSKPNAISSHPGRNQAPPASDS